MGAIRDSLTTADVPGFSEPARTLATTLHRTRAGSAYVRLYGPWFPVEVWYALVWDQTTDTVLCLHRTGYDAGRDEFVYLSVDALESLRGPNQQPVLVDDDFVPMALGDIR